MTDLLPVRGSPGSPYTRKMLALLRFRRIPYRYLQAAQDGLPEPKVKLIPIFYFANESGELEAEVDSTPIIRRLEAEYPSRSVIPEDPVMGFIDSLVEDYGDEWLTKAMFHYRWYYDADIDMAGSVLPHAPARRTRIAARRRSTRWRLTSVISTTTRARVSSTLETPPAVTRRETASSIPSATRTRVSASARCCWAARTSTKAMVVAASTSTRVIS